MCFIKHNWEKWEQYNVRVQETYFWQDDDNVSWHQQIRQKRICNDCGKMQDRCVR